MRRLQASEFLQESRQAVLLDVRSPGEYTHAHIPGAISLPLFTDEERAVVGTAYKQQSRQVAIKIGLDYFGPKMRPMVEEVEKLVGSLQLTIGKSATEMASTANRQMSTANSIFVYCWRGGMRSGAVAWLLNLYGFNVTVLAGGYKAFRNLVLKSFAQPYSFKILGGYTGSGKTALLQNLKAAGQNVIDLEALASHKGSAFGNINRPPQPTQEMFENRLSCELMGGEWAMANGTTQNHTWLEDESQRIGHVNIPGALWQTMRASPVYFLDIPFEERLAHILNEYGSTDRMMLAAAIERIKKRLGGLDAKNALQFLSEGNTEECFRILLRYYDRQYQKSLSNRERLSELLTTISFDTISAENTLEIVKQTHSTAAKNAH